MRMHEGAWGAWGCMRVHESAWGCMGVHGSA